MTNAQQTQKTQQSNILSRGTLRYSMRVASLTMAPRKPRQGITKPKAKHG